MRLLPIQELTTLRSLTDTIGVNNLSNVLHVNQLKRSTNIGEQYISLVNRTIQTGVTPTLNRKRHILDNITTDSDIFEYTSQLDDRGWKVMSNLNTLEGYINIPDSITLPTNAYMLGNSTSVSKDVYSKAMKQLMSYGVISPSVFNDYDGRRNYNLEDDTVGTTSASPFSAFKFPWGEVTLYNDIDGSSIDFPVYPEEVSDGHQLSLTQMPDLLYQYEPWMVYSSSGPRQNTYEFHFHRDMWTGDHRDGNASKLIRYCDACCYANYSGSAVHIPLVSLYVSGSELIHGILENSSVKWSGPLGLDGWYLECTLDITILEISKQALSYNTMRNKGLIG